MTILISLLFILLIVYAFLINFYRRAWNSIPVSQAVAQTAVKVSVIIAVRNEERNITRLLSCLNNQDYPPNLYEVIVVDDHSTDETRNILSKIEYSNLSLFSFLIILRPKKMLLLQAFQ